MIVIEGEERIEELPNSDDMTGSELAERMEICPSIPMFDLAGLATLAQWHGQQERGEGEEVPEGPVENEVRLYNRKSDNSSSLCRTTTSAS